MLFLHLLLITSGFFFYFDYNWRGPKPGPNNDQITATIKGSAGVWMVMYNQFCWK